MLLSVIYKKCEWNIDKAYNDYGTSYPEHRLVELRLDDAKRVSASQFIDPENLDAVGAGLIRVLYRFQAHTEDDMKELTDKRQCISSELRFYTISDMQKLLGWSEKTVKKLFNDPAFPSADFGKNKVVEAHAAIEYFSKKHEKKYEKYWQ